MTKMLSSPVAAHDAVDLKARLETADDLAALLKTKREAHDAQSRSFVEEIARIDQLGSLNRLAVDGLAKLDLLDRELTNLEDSMAELLRSSIEICDHILR